MDDHDSVDRVLRSRELGRQKSPEDRDFARQGTIPRHLPEGFGGLRVFEWHLTGLLAIWA